MAKLIGHNIADWAADHGFIQDVALLRTSGSNPSLALPTQFHGAGYIHW
jgi:hypothetical protein